MKFAAMGARPRVSAPMTLPAAAAATRARNDGQYAWHTMESSAAIRCASHGGPRPCPPCSGRSALPVRLAIPAPGKIQRFARSLAVRCPFIGSARLMEAVLQADYDALLKAPGTKLGGGIGPYGEHTPERRCRAMARSASQNCSATSEAAFPERRYRAASSSETRLPRFSLVTVFVSPAR